MAAAIKETLNTEGAGVDACACCLGTLFKPAMEGLERCTGCGHVRARLSWTPEMFHALYTEHYFKGGEYADYEQEGDALRLNFRKRMGELIKRHPQGGHLWEIGCAYGFFLQEAETYFNAAGCDVAREAVASAVAQRKVKAQCLDYLSYQPEQPFDVICLWDTIEHLPEPHLFLEKAFNDLRSGGTLALSTGDIGSLWARLRGKNWRLIHPPTHVHYFTCNSMTTLLKRLDFTEISFHYHAFWRNMATVMGKLANEYKGIDMIYSVAKPTGLLRFDFPSTCLI